MPDGELDLGLVVGPPGNIASATVTVNPGHLEQPTANAVMGGEPGEQTIEFTFEGLQGNDATLPIATVDIAGKVKPDGKSIRITEDGTISVDTVAVATTEVAGTVKPDGDTITVDTEGKIKVAKVIATTISGEISLANLPQGALERVVTVPDESSRFELTTENVQLGDVVKQTDTGLMYMVSDESKLSEAGGYTEFTAGTSTEATHSTSSDTATKLANPVQINGVDFDGSQAITVEDNTKLPLAGGTLTGNLYGKYLVGTWLQTTATTRLASAPSRYPVLDSAGWLYYRGTDDMKADLDIATKTEFPELLKSNIEVIREALGIVTKDKNGLVPKLPS